MMPGVIGQPPPAEPAIMADGTPHAVTMTVAEIDGRTVITVSGRSPRPTTVRYDLTISGASATHHRGRTRLDGHPRILSEVRITATVRGCAVLAVEEDDHVRYNEEVCF